MNQNLDISSSAILKPRAEKKSKKVERTKTTDDFMKLFLKIIASRFHGRSGTETLLNDIVVVLNIAVFLHQ